MKNLFNTIKLNRPKKNVFDLTHDVKLSCNMGDLIPIMVTEVIPGDHFTIGCESLVRLAPLVSPIFHRLDVTMHYFFVPNRILWSEWETWITASEENDFPVYTVNSGNYSPLMDYLGIPEPIGAESETVNAFPLAAYQMIYNEYYRDQNLIIPVVYTLQAGENNTNTHLDNLRKRAWEHDYFTASLPFAQKGTAVTIPLGEVQLNTAWQSEGLIPHFEEAGATPVDQGNVIADAVSNDIHTDASADQIAYDPNGSLEVESTTINDLRRAFKLQEWLEKNARGGTRYTENILIHFGVKSSDARLQRPEYITGIKSPIVISEVLNTTGEAAGLPQGNMAGHGIGVVSGKYGSKFIEEHGYIIGIMSIMPKTAYQQGLAKHWLKTVDQFQYFWPEFAHIGEQEVLNKEVYAFQGIAGANTFGYVPRYAEYKFENNRVAGEFRSSLDHWHMGRIFASAPALNQAFVEANPTTRVFAVESEEVDHVYVHVLNKVKAVRPMPKFGTPTF